MELLINFRGLELDVYFDRYEGEETVGLFERVEIYKVEYFGCNVWDIVIACDMEDELQEVVGNELDKM